MKNTDYISGRFEVQDVHSSKVLEYVQGNKILDLCAGRGGKTLGIACTLNNNAIDCYDIDKDRLKGLSSRISKISQYIKSEVNVLSEVTDNDYDCVLVDGPCSSSGVWRRWPNARWEFNVSKLPELEQNLTDILVEGMSRVKKGGRIVYCTCSLFKEENEDVVRNIDWKDWSKVNERRFPLNDEGDGFYVYVATKIN